MNKTLYIIAGANGSGKTTFAKSYSEIKHLYFINADEIAKNIDPLNYNKHQIKAGKEFFAQLDAHLTSNESFIIETTLSGKYLIEIIKNAKSLNFEVFLIYLFLSQENENILRVKNRVLNGGHNVPTEDIIRRYYRSRQLFNDVYKNFFDKWLLFYNGDDKYELVATNNNIMDEELFKLFNEGF